MGTETKVKFVVESRTADGKWDNIYSGDAGFRTQSAAEKAAARETHASNGEEHRVVKVTVMRETVALAFRRPH